jgi:hypothetical protein
MMIEWRGQKIYVAGWEPNAPEFCQMCGKQKNSLRPFGLNKQFVCKPCAKKNPEVASTLMSAAMIGADLIVHAGIELPKCNETDMRALLDCWLLEGRAQA